MEREQVVVGINFGSSYSSIAYLNQNGRPDCLANEDGDRQIPSVIAFAGEEEFIGGQALAQIFRNPQNTVAMFHDLLGKSFSEIDASSDIYSASLKNKDGKPAFEVEISGSTQVFTAGELATKFLQRLRESAEAYLGNPVSGAVLAVPAEFTDAQRVELTHAAENAGLKVLHVLHDTTAAMLAYGLSGKVEDKTVVVADLGAHSFNVSVVASRGGLFTILGTAHEAGLGGAALDELLVNHFAAEFKKKTKIDISGNRKALAKLRAAAEITKRTLSSSASAPCSVESLAEGIDFHSTINRIRFEMMANRVLGKCTTVIDQVLEKVELKPAQIDEVILVGGSARVPKFQAKLRDMFGLEEGKLRMEVEPDEAVAAGCAVQATLLMDMDKEAIEQITQPSMTKAPHLTKPIGVVDVEGKFHVILKADTPLPVRRREEMKVGAEKSVYVALWEGQHMAVVKEIKKEKGEEEEEEEEEEKREIIVDKAETLLAELALEQVQSETVELTLQVDADGKLTIILREKRPEGKVVKCETDGSA
ncbi:uncharacterized protein VTP21DRAFT_3766 [Calcarisporiella thermophila]|uniref:uncharacterized protein n=1 Tax=Calcarisporiella thermophila TaxID=911321 RepID=UPI003741F32B